MSRIKLNLVAGLIVLIGTWTVALPQPASGSPPPGQACCEYGTDDCCGDACRTTGTGCVACTGAACQWFFL